MSIQLTDKRIDEIREKLKDFINENPTASNRTIANELGCNTSYVSQFCNNKFPTKSKEAEFAEKVESFLNNIQISASDGSGYHLKFAMTNSAQEIFILAGYVLRQKEIGLVIGDNGFGKTISLEEHTRRNPNNILIQVTPLITVSSLLENFCSALNIPIEGSKNEMLEAIRKKLYGTNRIIAIDEGEHLPVPCLDIIRRIQDFTYVPLILSGSQKLWDRLNSRRSNLKYLNSRIGMVIKIDKLNIDDVRAILKVNFPEAVKYSPVFLQLSKNNGRFLEKIIKLVRDKIRETGAELSEELLDDAVGALVI